MLLRRVSVLAVLILTIGSARSAVCSEAKEKILTPEKMALFDDGFQIEFPQTIVQNTENENRSQPQWIQQLNLTEEQTARMKEIRNKYKDTIAEHQRSLRQAKQELRELMASSASREDIDAKNQQVQALQQQLEKLNFDSIMDLREVLTVEQRRQFDQIMKQRRENSHKGSGNG